MEDRARTPASTFQRGPPRRPMSVEPTFLPALLTSLVVACVDVGSPGAFLPPGGDNRTSVTYRSVSLGVGVHCALVNAGIAVCWGSGTLGDGRTTQSNVPVRVAGTYFFTAVSSGNSYTCALTSNDRGVCWGNNTQGSLGDGLEASSSTPVEVAGGLQFRSLDASTHTCGVTVDGEGYCWGQNVQGQLGTGSGESLSPVPARVAGGLSFLDIGVGYEHSCGLTTDGAVYCWGEDWGSVPTPVPTPLRFESLSVSRFSICALDAGGAAYCWGENWGQFGNGERDDPELGPVPYHQTPVPVETELRFSSIATDSGHTCAVTLGDQAVYCWGRDTSGEVGDGTPPGGVDEEFKLFPTRVRLSRQVIGVAVGGGPSCAVTAEFEGYCWGLRTGSASAPTSDEPVRIGG